MPEPTPTWSDTCAVDPVPAPDDDGPWCTTGLLPEQRSNIVTVTVNGELL